MFTFKCVRVRNTVEALVNRGTEAGEFIWAVRESLTIADGFRRRDSISWIIFR